MGKSGRLGRVARANKISRLGRGGLSGAVRSTLGYTTAAQRALINRNLGRLGYYDGGTYYPDTVPAPPSVLPSGGGSGSGGGFTTAQETSLISSAINAAGKVGTQAIIGAPSLTYNPLTGTYTASGGATIPSSLGLSTALSSYLPLILLAGGALVLVSVMGRR
jgi:hypothetical protein